MKKAILWLLCTIAIMDLGVQVAYADIPTVPNLATLGAVACVGIGILVFVVALVSFLVLRAIKQKQARAPESAARSSAGDDLKPGS